MLMTRLTAVAFATVVYANSALANPAARPDYYPDTYRQIVDGSRSEKGLVVYSSIANWGGLIEGFREIYPWIKVETLDVPSGTVHSRWEAEADSTSRTADLLASGATHRWVKYGIEGTMLNYESPETSKLPKFGHPYPGVYVLGTDPLLITYNKQLLTEKDRPTGLTSLAAKANADKGTFEGRVTTYDAARNAFGLAAWWSYLDQKGEAGWTTLRSLGPMIRGEVSGGPMSEKISTGEYVVGFGVAGTSLFPRLEKSGGEMLDFVFPDDGTIVMLMGLGIPKKAANPNSAKLFVDFALSHRGQTLLGKGGLVPYREDVDEKEVRYTYQGISERVGAQNVVTVHFDERLNTTADAFTEKWKAALQGK